MNPTIGEQLRELGFRATDRRRFETPAACLKRLQRERASERKMQSEIFGPVEVNGTTADILRASEARYLKYVRQPHSSLQWHDSRMTASGI